MGAIKDLYDLGRDLQESIQDTRTVGLIRPILDKITEIEREFLQQERVQMGLEKKHNEEIRKYQKDIDKLEERVKELELQIENNKKPRSNQVTLHRS